MHPTLDTSCYAYVEQYGAASHDTLARALVQHGLTGGSKVRCWVLQAKQSLSALMGTKSLLWEKNPDGLWDIRAEYRGIGVRKLHHNPRLYTNPEVQRRVKQAGSFGDELARWHGLAPASFASPEGKSEGAKQWVLKAERDPRLRHAVLLQDEQAGHIACASCRYSVPRGRGDGVIQVHHLNPMKQGVRTIPLDLYDYACPLCLHCHGPADLYSSLYPASSRDDMLDGLMDQGVGAWARELWESPNFRDRSIEQLASDHLGLPCTTTRSLLRPA